MGSWRDLVRWVASATRLEVPLCEAPMVSSMERPTWIPLSVVTMDGGGLSRLKEDVWWFPLLETSAHVALLGSRSTMTDTVAWLVLDACVVVAVERFPSFDPCNVESVPTRVC